MLHLIPSGSELIKISLVTDEMLLLAKIDSNIHNDMKYG